jgi:hypothetical protein
MDLEARKRKAISESAQEPQEDTGEQHNFVIRIDNISW